MITDPAAAPSTESALQIAVDVADPTISVVVTCYNYGHFLDACLTSLYAQSRRPDEIVVVDDGSTDGTAAVLADHADQVRVIRAPNGGQAAAFNRGFAATTGDIVLFLDADDLLAPVAIETVLLHWTDDLAVLTFGLQTVDAAGRSTGVHRASIEADHGDNRPQLLATGTFRFPPTSGNAFSRHCLAAILPMPEGRWRISADCYLIRAAALYGRFDRVEQILGHYRIHGGNSYAVGAATFRDLQRHAENQGDIADAMWALAEESTRFTQSPAEARVLADILRLRARAIQDDLAGLPPPPDRDLPGAVQALAVPRWPVHVPFNRRIETRRADGLPALDQIVVRDIAGSGWPVSRRLVLDFSVDPHPDVLTLELHCAHSADGTSPGRCVVSVNGTPTWDGWVAADTPARIPVRPDHGPVRRRLRVEVTPAGDAGPASDAVPVLVGLSVATQGPDYPVPHLDSGTWQPPGLALASALDPREWRTDAEGQVTLRGSAGHLRFSAPGSAERDLMLAFAAPVPRGTLILSERGRVLFNGATGVARWIVVRLPAASAPFAPHDVQLRFEPHASKEADARDGTLQIDAIGIMAGDFGRAPPLNPGQTLYLGASHAGSACLSHGWDASDPDGARNLAAEATILFHLPGPAHDLRLSLDLSPVLAPLPDAVHVVGVSLNGAILAAAALDGPGTVDVPLPSVGQSSDLRLVVHSTALQRPGAPADPGGAPGNQAALLRLHGMTLHGRADGTARERALALPRGAPPHRPAAQILLDRAARILADDTPDTQATAADLRAALTRFLATCSLRACLMMAATPTALETLAALGARARHAVRTPPEAATLADLVPALLLADVPRDPDANDAPPATDDLRTALLAILHAPACDIPQMAVLTRLPAPLFWSVPALAAWMAAPPEIETADAHRRYADFLGRLLGEVDQILAREAEDSALFRLAAEIVRHLRMTRVIFGRGVLRDLMRLRGRCVERLLCREGAHLPMARIARPSRTRVRIGVLVRDVTPSPEGWALLGMYGALDRRRFDPVLIRLDASPDAMDTGGMFPDEICLQGLGLEASVAAIRALDLDLFVTGAYAGEWEKAGWLLAHRLAPVQVWSGAVCPTTGGFRSFDRVLTCRSTEPNAPERHYLQPLAWIDGPLQAAYAFPSPVQTAAGEIRRALGLRRGRLMLVSGAMAHKIDDALLDTWASILAGAPKADLVLYPFAPNWAMAFAEERFRDRVNAAVARVGVAADRVRVLATQSTAAVQAIVSDADLYLDSFPYTGATTVCEALSSATPVLTLAGLSLRELTGASWVRAFGLPDLVATSPDDYVARAVALTTTSGALAALRRQLRRQARRGPLPHNDPETFGPAFSDALWRIAHESGLFPPRSTSGSLDMAAVDRVAPAARAAPALLLRVTSPAERFVVLGSPRCGSSLFCHMLNATAGVCCHYELFQENMIEYCGRTVRDPADVARRNADPVGFLWRTLADSRADGHTTVGFKHFSFFDRAVLAAVAADPSCHPIVLRRTNVLAKFASLRIAEATQQWKATPDTPLDHPAIPFEPKRFEEFERWDNGLYRDVEDALARYGREALFIEYQDICRPETGYRVGEFLGRALQWTGAVALQKMNPGPILDRFSNPDAVREYLSKRGVPAWADNG